MPEFNYSFPTSRHGDNALNVMDFGAYGDGIARDMNNLGYANLAAAQAVYPSCTAMTDTADWCAITECFKQAYTDGAGTPNGTASWLNKPIRFPTGRYHIRKPLVLTMDRSIIYGTGYVLIYNEANTAPNNICLSILGMQASRIENIDFQTAGGTGSIAVDLDAKAGGVVNSTGDMFVNCNFSSPSGIGCRIGNTQMSSEMTFIRCLTFYCTVGFSIDGFNALNYQFLACGGFANTSYWLKVNAGGMCVVQNASLAENGTDPDGYDIFVGGGMCVVLGSRTESKRFISGGPTTLIGCSRLTPGGADHVFSNAGPVHISNCLTTMGRLCGPGPVTTDDSNLFNYNSVFAISNVANNGSGLIRITHAATTFAGTQTFLDGDEVSITGVTSTGGGAAATNGVWIIDKIDATHVDLIGSTFVTDAYTYTGAWISPGPRFHLREIAYVDGPSYVRPIKAPRRSVHETKAKNTSLVWLDSDGTFDNLDATGDITFTLPVLTSPGLDRCTRSILPVCCSVGTYNHNSSNCQSGMGAGCSHFPGWWLCHRGYQRFVCRGWQFNRDLSC